MKSFLNQSKYETEIDSVDFADHNANIEAEVNAWVDEKTNGMIPKLLDEGSLDDSTILVLLNAVYLKCQ